jgi:M6 family metalloprotease-like protein
LLPSLLPGVCRGDTAVPAYRARDSFAQRASSPVSTRLNVYQRASVRGLLDKQAAGIDTLRILALQVQFADSLIGGDRDSTYFANELKHVTQYYDGASRGELVVTWRVTPRLYTVPKPMGYYGEDDFEDVRDVELMQTVIDSADADEDFSSYDTFMMIHAQPGQETDIFDNSRDQLFSTFFDRTDIDAAFEDSTVYGLRTNDTLGGQPFLVDNFMVVPEDASQDDITIGSLGIWAFEVGSRLGLLPLFDSTPSGFPDSRGIGEFDLMSYGLFNAQGYIPAFPSAFNRVIVGWVEPIDVVADASFRLHDINSPALDDTVALRISITESEYFLVVNRVHDTNFDSLFTFTDLDSNQIPDNTDSLDGAEFDFFLTDFTNPFIVKPDPDTGNPRRFINTGSGVYIWHVDENVIRQNIDAGMLPNNYSSRKGVDMEEADGIQDMDNASGAFSFGSHFDSYRDGNNTTFSPTSNPNSASNSLARSGISVTDVTAPDSFMTCSVQIAKPYGETRTRWMAPARHQPPTAFDLDAVGADELVVLADTGHVYAFKADGSEFVDRDGDPSTIEPYFSVPGAVWVGAPAFGDIDGGGDEEIVATSTDGNVFAWKGDGTEVFDGDSNPLTNGILYEAAPLAAPPMLVDVDDDTHDDIVIVERVADSLVIRFVNGSGQDVAPSDAQIQTIWPVRFQAQYCAPLAYGALGKLGDDSEGVVIAWADTIRTVYGIYYFPVKVRSGAGWQIETAMIQPKGALNASFSPLSSPSIADLNGDGFDAAVVTIPDGRMAIFAPSTNFPTSDAASGQRTPPAIPNPLRIVDLRATNPSAPGLGDIDGNGTVEIAVFDDSNFYVFENNGKIRTNWSRPQRPTELGDFPPLAFDNTLTSPLIGNINDDANTEIIFPVVDGTIFVFSPGGTIVSGFPRVGPSGLGATPTIRDLDGSGELSLVALGVPGLLETVDAVSDSLLLDDTVVLSIQSLPGSSAPGQNDWPMYQHDRKRQGRVGQTNPQPAASGVTEPNSFIVYPNPVRDSEVHARIILNTSAIVDVEIYNLEGEKAISEKYTWYNSGGAVQTPFDEIIDVKKLASGVYLLRLLVEAPGGPESFVKTFAVLR